MIRKILFILFLITLASALGAIILEKIVNEIAIDRCMDNGGTWNFMEQQCD